MIQRNDRHERGARLNTISDLRFSLGDVARDGRADLLTRIFQMRLINWCFAKSTDGWAITVVPPICASSESSSACVSRTSRFQTGDLICRFCKICLEWPARRGLDTDPCRVQRAPNERCATATLRQLFAIDE